MEIRINTDSNIDGETALTEELQSIVGKSLDRFSKHVRQVDVYLSDANSDMKFGVNDKRCLLEVRLAGHQPSVASDQAPTLEQAVHGAAEKMRRALETTLGRLDNR